MTSTPHAWWDFGYAGIFGCVFLEQIGVPIPAFPALLAAGALVASGDMSLMGSLAVAVTAALLADAIWYGIGRAKGGKVLNLMCRVSWKPDTCVTKTKNLFTTHGLKTLLVAKFVPGLSTIAPPLAGITLVPFGSFIAYDGAGTILWALAPIIAGAYLQKSFVALQAQVQTVVAALPWVCGFLIIAVLVWRYVNRSQYLKSLRLSMRSGISVDALKLLLDKGDDIAVLDVRDEISLKAQPVILPKARWIPSSTISERLAELALDKPIIVYCDCPEDQSAIASVNFLREHGAKQARPLHGGLEAWISRGFSTTELQVIAA